MPDTVLLTALRALGVNQASLEFGETLGASDGYSTSADSFIDRPSASTTLLIDTQLTRDELLRITHQLVDGLLQLQAKMPSSTPSYLNVVFPCLFVLVDADSQDVRIAADEGLNKLIKFLRVSMTNQVICELFLEIKRNRNARSVSASLSRFATMAHRIRAPKRRFYLANFLPVLINICERDDESVFEALSDNFGRIASVLFYHATESELREFLRKQLDRLSSETALVRRSMAQLLVQACEFSCSPLIFFRLLLRQILVELVSPDQPSTHRCAGLFTALRYLSLTWQRVSETSTDKTWMTEGELGSRTAPSKSVSRINLVPDNQIPGIAESFTGSNNDEQLWSVAFFTCLDFASAPSIIISTPALEALVQLLVSRQPQSLYPRQWLMKNKHPLLKTLDVLSPKETTKSFSIPQSTDFFDPVTEHLNSPEPSDSAIDSSAQFVSDPLSMESFCLDTNKQSLTPSTSVASFSDLDPDTVLAQRELDTQLSAMRDRQVRAQAHRLVGHHGTHTRSRGHWSGDYSFIDSATNSSDPSIINIKSASPGSIDEDRSNGDISGRPQVTVKANLLPLRELLGRLYPADDAVSVGDSAWIPSYLILWFHLRPNDSSLFLPCAPAAPRTSNQLLAIGCLIQLVQLNPFHLSGSLTFQEFCSEPREPDPVPSLTGADLILGLLQSHSDPQVRGQLCLLIGSWISSYLVRTSLAMAELPTPTQSPSKLLHELFQRLQSVLRSEISGTAFRSAFSGLRVCANALISCPEIPSDEPGQTSLALQFLHCLSRFLVPSARHSYRLVRREFLLFCSDLNWTVVNRLEDQLTVNRAATDPLPFLARPVRLLDVARIEAWRLLADPDPELRDLAASTLIYGLGCCATPTQSPCPSPHLERRLHFWFPNIYSSYNCPIRSFGLLNCSNAHNFPPCFSGLQTDLDVGPVGWRSLPEPIRLAYVEANRDLYCSNALGLFRRCADAMLELPCGSLLPEDHCMLHGVVRCLNRLIGDMHLMAFRELWYDQPVSDGQHTTNVDELLHRQRRPRFATVSWHCLNLLSAVPVTTSDLDLHLDLLNFCTGTLTRWAMYSLTEGSIVTGAHSMMLDLRHSYTRFALNFLQHVARVLFMLWHIIEDCNPTRSPPVSSHADPFKVETLPSIVTTIAELSRIPLISVGSSDPSNVLGAISRKANFASKSGTSVKKTQTDQSASEAHRILGYFSHLPHYMALYQILKAAFQTFKISPDSSGLQDRFIDVLRAYLSALGRLVGHLRLAEVAPYSNELITYVFMLYRWQPSTCLEVATQLLRSFVGTNLISHWDEQLSVLYNDAFRTSSSLLPTTAGTSEDNCSSVHTRMHSAPPNPVDALFNRSRAYNLLLNSHNVRISWFASWLGLEQLRRAPITAWIRFARQWRVPRSLTCQSPAIKSELTVFLKRFERLVVRSMFSYKLTYCSELQSSILNLMTHLICLRMNYKQLDSNQEFLQSVISHCENLSLETPQYGPLTVHGKVIGSCTSLRLNNDAFHFRSDQQLSHCVNAMFRFFVTLVNRYDDRSATVSSAGRLIDLNQVIHMAEILVAESLDAESILLPALSPIVVDLFVIHRPLIADTISSQQLEQQAKNPVFLQLEAQREAVANFLLRRLSHLPASYDLFCLVIEEATLPRLASSDHRGNRFNDIISQVLGSVINHLSCGSTCLHSRADLDSIVRLFDHLVIALACPSQRTEELCRSLIVMVKNALIRAYMNLGANAIVLIPPSRRFFCWAAANVVGMRFLFQTLARFGQPGGQSDIAPENRGVILELIAIAFKVLGQLIRSFYEHLIDHTGFACSITSLSSISSLSSSFLLSAQLLFIHLVTLTELMEYDQSDVQFHNDLREAIIGFQQADLQFIDRQILEMGLFEPLLPSLWARLIRFCRFPTTVEFPIMERHLHWIRSPISGCLNAELVAQQLLKNWLEIHWCRNEKCSVVLRNLFTGTNKHQAVIVFRHLFSLWHSQCEPVRDLFSRINDCVESSEYFLKCCSRISSSLTLCELRWLLQLLLEQPVHVNLMYPQLAMLLNQFVLPHSLPVTSSSTSSTEDGVHLQGPCTNCRRSLLPLGLQIVAIRKAVRLLEWFCSGDPVVPIVSLPRDVLLDYQMRITKVRSLQPHVQRFITLLEKSVARYGIGMSKPLCFDSANEFHELNLDIPSIMQHMDQGGKTWLLDLAQWILSQCLSPSAARAAACLMQTAAESDRHTIDQRVIALIRRSCHSCCPALLLHILICGLPGGECMYTLKTKVDLTHSAPVAGKQTIGSLFRIGKNLLFENIQHIVVNPERLYNRMADPWLHASIQSHLTGLCTCLVYFLQLIPGLPSIDSIPIQTETMALCFLHVLIEFQLAALGHCPLSPGEMMPPSIKPFSCSLSLLNSTLTLMEHLLQTISEKLIKGVDLLGDRTAETLGLFLTFLALIDRRASISESLITFIPSDQSFRYGQSLINDPIVINLLTPEHPSLLSAWCPSPLPASLISDFTSVSITSSASAILAGGGNTSLDPSTSPLADRIAPCQVLNICRLLRSSLSSSIKSRLKDRITRCLISCIRILDLRTSNVASSSVLKTEPDPDRLASVVAQRGSFGWLTRKQFEQMWISYLELLANPAECNTMYDMTASELNFKDLEQLDRNRCVVLGQHGLTRLLSDAALWPYPGDPLHSYLRHQPRSLTPHFLHTKLGQNLAKLVALIEYELSSLDKIICFPDPSFTSTVVLATDAKGCEPNLERFADPTDRIGPSQLAVHWLVRRLTPIIGDSSSVNEDPSDGYVLADYPANEFPKSKSADHAAVEFDDLLLSCLQSTQLLYQSWEGSTTTSQSQLPEGSREFPSDSITGDSPAIVSVQRSGVSALSKTKGLALAVSSAVVRSNVILSDLFTTQEQFEWLKLHLKETLCKLPSVEVFPAPIHVWLTLGLAKCTAVLELARSNSQLDHLQSSSFEPAVHQVQLALRSSIISVQDSGFQAAIWLLHAALLVRSQPHQRQSQQHIPPTGSPLLNELYAQVCRLIQQKLVTLFDSVNRVGFPHANTSAAASKSPLGASQSTVDAGKPVASPGFRRLVAGVFGSYRGSSAGHVIGAPETFATLSQSKADTVTEHHQLIVLATAFFLAEHFSAPPIYPLHASSGTGAIEMLSGLSSSLFHLAYSMLSDTGSAQISMQEQNYLGPHGSGTTMNLCCSVAVHSAWCRGMERLILLGKFGSHAIDSLQKLCITRLRGCRSPRISLPVLRLLITCVYANVSRLRHVSSQQPTESQQPVADVSVERPRPSSTMISVEAPLTVRTATVEQSSFLPSETSNSMTEEFLGVLWERLRGGVTSTTASLIHPSWAFCAWTSPIEASLIAQFLPSVSIEIIHTIQNKIGYSKEKDANVNQILNQAVGEFARVDHAHPHLAAQALSQLFGLFLHDEEGRALVRQWVLLSIPTLLTREPRRLAIRATTVCLVAAATHSTLRSSLCVCLMDTDHLSSVDSDLPSDSMSSLMSDLLCLSALHFLRVGLLCIRDNDTPDVIKNRLEERLMFMNMFKPFAESPLQSSALRNQPGNAKEGQAFERAYWLIKQELRSDRSHRNSSPNPI